MKISAKWWSFCAFPNQSNRSNPSWFFLRWLNPLATSGSHAAPQVQVQVLYCLVYHVYKTSRSSVKLHTGCHATSVSRADSRFAPRQWETSLQSNAVSHRLGANQDSALRLPTLGEAIYAIGDALECKSCHDAKFVITACTGKVAILTTTAFQFPQYFFKNRFWTLRQITILEIINRPQTFPGKTEHPRVRITCRKNMTNAW